MQILTKDQHISTWIEDYFNAIQDDGSFCDDCPYNMEVKDPYPYGEGTVFNIWSECNLNTKEIDWQFKCRGIQHLINNINAFQY